MLCRSVVVTGLGSADTRPFLLNWLLERYRRGDGAAVCGGGALFSRGRAPRAPLRVYDGPMPPVYGERANAAFMRRWVTENARSRQGGRNPWGDDEPACDLPAYDMGEWMASQGRRLPDHPAIFTGAEHADGGL